MTTLLQKAQAHRVRPHSVRSTTGEDIELALAWVRGEISLKQVSFAYGIKPNQVNSTYIRLARALKTYIQNV